MRLYANRGGLWIGCERVGRHSGWALAYRHYPWSITWSWALYWNTPVRGFYWQWIKHCGFWLSRQAEMINPDQMERDIVGALRKPAAPAEKGGANG